MFPHTALFTAYWSIHNVYEWTIKAHNGPAFIFMTYLKNWALPTKLWSIERQKPLCWQWKIDQQWHWYISFCSDFQTSAGLLQQWTGTIGLFSGIPSIVSAIVACVMAWSQCSLNSGRFSWITSLRSLHWNSVTMLWSASEIHMHLVTMNVSWIINTHVLTGNKNGRANPQLTATCVWDIKS